MSGCDLLGYLAALMVGVTFCCRTMVMLRCNAIVSNVLFIAYATLMGLIPILVLHVALLAINIIHLASEVRKPTRSGC